jgi:hypothetical protein
MKHFLFLIASLGAAASANAQGFVERAAAAGLVHDFRAGLDRVGSLAPMADWSQQGVGIGDLDNDGDMDLVAVSRLEPNHVFRNDGGGFFSDVSTRAGIDTSAFDSCVALGDYDRDGDLDVFIGALEHGEDEEQALSRLYANDGGFVFRDVTAVSGTTGAGHTIHAAFVDLDKDGMLDLFTSEFHGTQSRLYRNEGDGSFSEIAESLGLDTYGSVHVTAFLDVDGDGLLDVIPGTDWKVTNSADMPNNTDDIHLRGQADGTFLDVTAGSGTPKDGPPNFGSATMGIAVGDVDYDGDYDLYETEISTQFLMINNGWPTSGLPWTQAQTAYGVANVTSASPTGSGQTVGWGCAFFDADLDLWLDLYKVNGKVSAANPRNQQSYFFKGQGPGAAFAFSDQTAAFGLNEFFDKRGLAVGDMDDDGDVDILSCPPAGLLRYYENQVDRLGQGFVAVNPVCGTSAPGGFGVEVSWTDSLGYPHKRLIGADGQCASQNRAQAHFGIGFEPSVDLTVKFPSGMTLAFPATAPNTTLAATEPVMVELPGRVLPTRSSGGAPMTGAPTASSVPASGPVSARFFKVKAHAYAQDGTPLGGSAVVTIDIPGIAPAGAVKHVSGNTFERAFQLPKVEGRHSVEVSFDGWELAVKPTISFRGDVASAQTSALLAPPAVRAGSADTFEVRVTPRDAGGRLVPATNVTVSSGTAVPLTSLTPQGDGSFAATIAAPTAQGSHALAVTVDGVALGTLATLESAGTALGATSLFYDEVPNPNFAMTPHQYKFLVTPRDLFGRKIGPGATLSLVINPGIGSQTVTQASGLVPSNRVNGDYLFVLEKPVGAAVNTAFGTVDVLVNGVLLFTKTFSF